MLTTWHRMIILSALLLLLLAATPLLLRQGSQQAVSLVCLCGYWAVATALIILNGSIHSLSLALYLGLPISAACPLGNRASKIVTGVCLLIALALAILEQQGVSPIYYNPGLPMSLWTMFLLAMTLATVPITRILRILQAELIQSKSDQQTLETYRTNLEQSVERRSTELAQARDQARTANQAKGTLLATMSHESRATLNAILGSSTLMQDDVDVSERHRRYLAIFSRSGAHLLDLIDNVMDLVKIEAGRILVEDTAFDLENLPHDAIDIMRERTRVKNLQLLLDVSPAVRRFVRSDGAKLHRILVNLVGNAIKFSDQGGVSLRLNIQPAGNLLRMVLRLEAAAEGPLDALRRNSCLHFDPAGSWGV